MPALGAAWLLFAIEPMLAKLLLPTLGGSPTTWAACLLTYQLLLLVGYGYVHLGARWLDVRRQAALHLLLLVGASVSLLLLGPGTRPQLAPLPLALAVPWFVVQRVGLPFVALAATTPLLSRAATALGAPNGRLYAFSNAGALLGLVGYPLLVERYLGLSAQFSLWSAGFLLLVLSLLPLGVSLLAKARAERRVSSPVAPLRGPLRLLGWACVPSGLLVAVTEYMTVDVAATPLLWVLPLAVYLASFIVAFSVQHAALRGVALAAWFVGTVWLGLNVLGQGVASWSNQVAAGLVALGGASLTFHGLLAERRPRQGDDSAFYLWLAAGGALGGVVAGLVAPLIFRDFYELELFSAAALLLAVEALGRRRVSRPLRLLTLLGASVCLPLLLGEVLTRAAPGLRGGRVLERRRSFLGALRVVDFGTRRVLTHGRIQHGMQLRGEAQRRTPTLYFAAGTAVARVLSLPSSRPRRLGVVGLGVGTLATFGRAGDALTFFELDPNVVDLARRDFTFLRDSPAHILVVPGDGRSSLQHVAPASFDVLVLDAFSSDSVPAHLLTREAFELYRRDLAADGLLLANVSNRHVAVERVVEASARAAGLVTRVVETRSAEVHVSWAVMARDASQLELALGDLPLQPARAPEVLWTDSRASLWAVLR